MVDESTIWKGHSTISNELLFFFLVISGGSLFVQSIAYLIVDRFSLNSSSCSLFNFSHVPRFRVNGWICVSKRTSSHLEQYTNTRRRQQNISNLIWTNSTNEWGIFNWRQKSFELIFICRRYFSLSCLYAASVDRISRRLLHDTNRNRRVVSPFYYLFLWLCRIWSANHKSEEKLSVNESMKGFSFAVWGLNEDRRRNRRRQGLVNDAMLMLK